MIHAILCVKRISISLIRWLTDDVPLFMEREVKKKRAKIIRL